MERFLSTISDIKIKKMADYVLLYVCFSFYMDLIFFNDLDLLSIVMV